MEIVQQNGYKLFKYERFKDLLKDNKALKHLFIPSAYHPEKFENGTNYINLELLYPNWNKLGIKPLKKKGPKKKKSKKESKIEDETKQSSQKLRKKLKKIPLKLRMDYRAFKEQAFKTIEEEWNALTPTKQEEYNKKADSLIEKKTNKTKRYIQEWTKFKQSVEKTLSEQKIMIQANKEIRAEIKELKTKPQNKQITNQIKNKRKALSASRQKLRLFHDRISQYKNTFQKQFVESFKIFSNVPATEILELAKVLRMETLETKDEKTQDKWEEEYDTIQALIQTTISKQQQLINENKTKLIALFQQIREKYNDVKATNVFTNEDFEKVKSENKTPKEIKAILNQQRDRLTQKITTKYKQLIREKDQLLKQFLVKLKSIEKKTGLQAAKKSFEKKMETYEQKISQSDLLLKDLNEKKRTLDNLKKKLTTLKIEIIKLNKNKQYNVIHKLFKQRKESLNQARNFTQKEITNLEKAILDAEKSKEYQHYLFQTTSSTFKWIRKIEVLFNIYSKQLNILKSISTIKPTYIEFKKEAFILKRPSLGQIPDIPIQSLVKLYKKFYNSNNAFLTSLTGYLPDDHNTNPSQCKKVLVKVGTNMLLNNNNVPIKFTNTNCVFLYINEHKTKNVNGEIYYQLVDKNLKFISKNGLLNQCSNECPKKNCKEYMPFSDKRFKCINGACLTNNSNNDNVSYTKLVRNYREEVLKTLISLFKKKLKIPYPFHTIYASNVEKYYYINSVNFLSYIFNCSMIFSLLSITIHPDCQNHIVVTLKSILKESDYKNLPLNFKDILNFICSNEHYKSHQERSLIGILFLKNFKKILNTQLNSLYMVFDVTARSKKFVESSVIQSTKMWQDNLITLQYTPTDNSKSSVYKAFLKNIYTLIQSDIKKLKQSLRLAKTKFQKKRIQEKLVEFNDMFIGHISSLTQNIMHTISSSNFNPYFYNLLQLNISNFLIYYSTIANTRNVTKLLTQLQTALHNTLTQSSYNKHQMIKIKKKITTQLESKEEIAPQIVTDVVVMSDSISPEILQGPILWSRKSCNPLLAQLDQLIQQSQPKSKIKVEEQKEEKVEEKVEEKKVEEKVEEKKVEEKVEEKKVEEKVEEKKVEKEQSSFSFQPTQKCFQCQKDIKNKALRTVHLKNNKVVSFCGMNCFTKYND